MKKILSYYGLVVVLITIHFLLGIDTIKHYSPTYDEHVHLVSGYSYWKTGGYFLNIYDHPPVIKLFASIPLLFMKPILPINHPTYVSHKQYSFADIFFYHNIVDAEKMLNSARLMMLVISCLLGYTIYFWSKQIYGRTTAVIILLFYVFSSNFIAHGILVTTDVGLSFFYFLSMYYFCLMLKKGNFTDTILCGIFSGLALGSKFSAVIIFPVYFLIYFLVRKKINIKNLGFHFVVLGVMTIFTISVIYKFDLGLYIDGIKHIMKEMQRGRSVFLCGNYSTTGFIYYFLVVFLIKTPILFLVILLLLPFFYRKKDVVTNTVLITATIVYFISASVSRIQLGLRHILPIYPFLFVLSGDVIDYIISDKNVFKKSIILCIAIGSYIYPCIKLHPWHLSYCNELFGGAKNGYKYLTDSNIDWGQGLKQLGIWLNKNFFSQYKDNPFYGIYFSYFGVGDPHYYGIRYRPVGFISNLDYKERPGDKIEFLPDEKILFAISVTNLQATYYRDKNVFSFIKKYQPLKVIAESIFVYDLTDKPQVIKKIKEIINEL